MPWNILLKYIPTCLLGRVHPHLKSTWLVNSYLICIVIDGPLFLHFICIILIYATAECFNLVKRAKFCSFAALDVIDEANAMYLSHCSEDNLENHPINVSLQNLSQWFMVCVWFRQNKLVWFSPCFRPGFFVSLGKVLMWIAFGVFMVNFVESKEHAFVSHCWIFLLTANHNIVTVCSMNGVIGTYNIIVYLTSHTWHESHAPV